MKIYDEEEVKVMIEDCVSRQEKMNDWECCFLSSIGDQFDKGIMLSDNQTEKLDDIWKRIT